MKNNSAARSIYVIGALFFVFGFVTWINSVLIPFLKQICELTDFQAYFVTFAFYISYFVMAIPSSWVLRRSGFVRGMSYGLLAMAVGSILFIPAALDRSYALFLLGLFLQGTGLALLQTASVCDDSRPDRERCAAHQYHGCLQQDRRHDRYFPAEPFPVLGHRGNIGQDRRSDRRR